MIGYTTLGTNKFEAATEFYDQLLSEFGATRILELGRCIAWGTNMEQTMLGIIKPVDGQPATVGNGVMVALTAKDPAHVDALHAKALELGATDEGAPGERMPGFYAAYFRDLDGNKLAFYHFAQAE